MAVARQKRSGGQLRSRKTPGATIFSEETFHRTFHLERLLADRGHRRFCVAIFRLLAHGFRPARDPDVAKVLLRHARLTDDIGFLHGAALHVLLRETGPEGAAVFCKRAAGDLSKIGADVAWRVFRYPHTEYQHYQPRHRQRCEALPALPGLWQVSGKNRLSFAQMVRLESPTRAGAL